MLIALIWLAHIYIIQIEIIGGKIVTDEAKGVACGNWQTRQFVVDCGTQIVNRFAELDQVTISPPQCQKL